MSQKWTDIGNIVKNKTKDGTKEYTALTFNEDVFVQVDGSNVTKPDTAKTLMAFVSDKPMETMEKRGISFGKDKPNFGVLEVYKDHLGNVKKTIVRINKDVNIAKGSDILEINQYRNAVCNDPVERVEKLIGAGHITGDDIESRRQSAQDAAAWLVSHVTLPPPTKKD